LTIFLAAVAIGAGKPFVETLAQSGMPMLLAVMTLAALALAAWHHAGWPLLLSRLARGPARPPPPLPDRDLPAITLVMPAYNEAAFIAAKLRNLAALDYPRDRLMVILACDGCTDGTAAIALATLREPDCAGLRAEVRDLAPNRGKQAWLYSHAGDGNRHAWMVDRAVTGVVSPGIEPGGKCEAAPPDQVASFSAQVRMNARRSALMVSAWVVGIPCGKPAYVFSVPF